MSHILRRNKISLMYCRTEVCEWPMRSKLPESYGANWLMERARREQYFSTRVAFVFLASGAGRCTVNFGSTTRACARGAA